MPRRLPNPLALVLLLALALPAHAAAWRTTARAEAFYHSAQRRLQHSTFETRRSAIQDLEQATLLAPDNPVYHLALARLYLECGFNKYAQKAFERVVRIAPEDADSRLGLGQIWRRDYLKYLERPSLDRAIENDSIAAALRPGAADAWLSQVPLLLERNRLRPALTAAVAAVRADPRRADAVLALAEVEYRTGGLSEADSLFRLAIPRLPRLAREKFDDISPVATERDTFVLHRLSTAGQRDFIARFWIEKDPDPASPENEAQLEYWARVAQAYFLYFNAKRREWDARGELYVRYGPPRNYEYNPFGATASVMGFPINVQWWIYPEMGMGVELQDRTLSEYYTLPFSMEEDTDPRPNPDSLARYGGTFAVSGGRGVFPRLAPGFTPLRVNGHLARFSGESGPRLLADIEAAGAPDDSLYAVWVVLDSTLNEVARGGRALSPSACDPAELRVADFAEDLPPGRYRIGITVSDGGMRRGVYRTDVRLGDDGEQLGVSDVMVSCGTPAVGAGPGVRIEPNARGLVSPGGPLTAYFEIYHLAMGDDGQSHFEYECLVRSAEKDARLWVKRLFQPRPRIPEIETKREVENVGPLRRQFVSVPVQALPAGRYRLDITVRDLVAGREVSVGAPFLKTGSGPAAN